MYKGFKVVGVTAYGRRRYARILSHYLKQARNLIDEHHFWLNTQDSGDILWLRSCVASAPDFFRVIRSKKSFDHGMLNRICSFYAEYAADPNTIFVRFDDDIVWIAPDAIRELLAFRVLQPNYFLVFANTINNSICTFLHQRQGLLSECPAVEYECMGPMGWSRWQVAASAHSALLSAIRRKSYSQFYFEPWELSRNERCSINCIAWWGKDMSAIINRMCEDEEQALACDIPRYLGRSNCVVGQALVSHFAYVLQRPGLEANTRTLERYSRLLG